MTNKEILDIAMTQSAIDSNCDKSDFLKSENVIAISEPNSKAKKYLNLPFYCGLTSYGGNIIVSVNPEIADFVKKYLNNSEKGYSPFDRFESPYFFELNKELNKHDMQIQFMAEYFLPDVNLLIPRMCDYKLKILEQKDFAELYRPEWSNAFCEKRKHLDVLGIGAYHSDKLIGLAGCCSADCETICQIGVDFLPEYRRLGIASTLTTNLSIEILNRGKVPFYCCAWSNIKSVKNAIKSGFSLTWVQMTARGI
ncbi:MAG: GNAT family N-acetyltransferase [Candidatus Paraimprobicoccus trichonymphae]|uniref:GNAT family N-acetyltransferase n=1 Tax=Candidatus Paraimprobicoccus trichonymphae TaxID=3033793 RepID=A0AA48L1A0_9FIRM|nr:MAG: GNAT family N-acetyltransferase [Candidatus Paraimprobicoccus trichonymphae]